MDFSKLLNAIRGNKAADASATPKDRPEDEAAIPVEIAPTVLAADHHPPARPSGGVMQSLLGQLTGNRELPPLSKPPVTEPANSRYVDDVLASVLPPPSSPLSASSSPADPGAPPSTLPAAAIPPPLEGDWFDVSLDVSTPGERRDESDSAVLELPPEDLPPVSAVPQMDEPLRDTVLTVPSVSPGVDPFEVPGHVDLSWTPMESAPMPPAPVETELLPQGDGKAALIGGGVSELELPPAAVPPPVPPPLFNPLDDFTATAGGSYAAPDDIAFGVQVAANAYTDAYTAAPGESTDLASKTGQEAVAQPPEATAGLPSTADWLLENLDEAILLVDAAGVIHRVNAMAEYLLGCERAVVQGQTLLDLSQQLGNANAPLWEHLAVTPDAQQFSTSIILPDGQPMMASFVVMELPPLDAWPGGRIIAVRDETRLRAELSQTADESPAAPPSALTVTPEQLTAMRTSLQMVLGFAELLHRGEYGPMNPQQFEMFRNIEHHAKQLAEWIGLPQT